MEILRDEDLQPEGLAGRRVTVLGYGSQGRAQALCLRDSGCTVRVGTRQGPSRDQARRDGFDATDLVSSVEDAQVVAFLVPDSAHAAVLEKIRWKLAPSTALVFAHGFTLLYGQVEPPPHLDVVLVAPMGAGPTMRSLFEKGSGVAALVAVHQDATGEAQAVARAYAKALGCGRVGVIPSTVREEVETDLFGEQAVLCGGLTALMLAGFDTLVEAGYPEETAYLECIHQVRQLAALVHEHGIAGMRSRISDTALYGDLTRGPRVVGETSRAAMREILEEIRSGQFAKEWLEEQAAGLRNLESMRERAAHHPAEHVRNRLLG